MLKLNNTQQHICLAIFDEYGCEGDIVLTAKRIIGHLKNKHPAHISLLTVNDIFILLLIAILGRNKAIKVSEEIRRIAPDIKSQIYCKAIYIKTHFTKKTLKLGEVDPVMAISLR